MEAAAAARAAAAAAAALRGPSGAFGGLGMRMVPKSMREEMAAKEAKAQELAAARVGDPWVVGQKLLASLNRDPAQQPQLCYIYS